MNIKFISAVIGLSAILIPINYSALYEIHFKITENISLADTKTILSGKASWYDYGLEYEPFYSKYNLTCASRDYERNTFLKVVRKDTGKYIVCRVNDWVENKDVVIDLSSYAFSKLASLRLGIIEVEIIEI